MPENLDFMYAEADEDLLTDLSVYDYVFNTLDALALDEWPDEITVLTYERMTIPDERLCVLDDLLERLDEDYGPTDDDMRERDMPTAAMREAEEHMKAVVLRDYTVYRFEPTGEEEVVKVWEWVLAERPWPEQWPEGSRVYQRAEERLAELKAGA